MVLVAAFALLLLSGEGAIEIFAQTDEGLSPLWWNDRVFYEIFVRSFRDSDGDGIGDLQGVYRPAGIPQ